MKNIFRKIIAVTAAALLTVMCAIPACADDAITVNGREVSVGDTVTYELYIGELETAAAGVSGSVFYDSDCLEIVDGSIGFDVLNNAGYAVVSSRLSFAATNAINGYDFEEDGLVVTVAFEVLDTAAGSTTITYEIDEIFANDDNLTDIEANEYVVTEKVSTNTYTGTNSAPYLGEDIDDESIYDAYTPSSSADTTSASDSSGDSTAEEGGSSTSEESDTSSLTEEQQLLLDTLEGVKNPDYTGTYDTADTVLGTASSDESADSESSSVSLAAVIAIVVGVLAVLLLIGGAVYFSVKKNK